MIGIMIAAALVTQTYGGNMSVVPGLTDHDCAEAASLALYARTIEQKAADDAKAAADAAIQKAKDAAAQAKWEADHPKRAAACKAISEVQSMNGFVTINGGDCGPESGPWTLSTNYITSSADPYAIKLAECVK